MKSLLLLSSGLIFISCLSYAQGSSPALSQLKVPVNARAGALGEGTVSDAGQFSSWSLNPANLYAKDARSLTLTHVQWIQDIQTEFIGVRFPLAKGSAALAVSTNSIPAIEIREKPGPAIGTFTARFASLEAGFATNVMENFSAGMTVKYLYQKLYLDDAVGFGIDLGVLYQTPIPGLQFAAAVTNSGSLEQFRGERSDLPTFVRVGAAYHLGLNELHFRVSASSASSLQNSENHIGGSAEGLYKDFLAVRIGYQTGYDSHGITAGAGIVYEFLSLDYGYVPFTYGFGGAHLLSLGFQF
ncbi:MAG TPA: hypothetical protein DEP53_12555 [Bacteroidetes bacterium]|nr:hypothetical protein [Bacteroidota bacterium]